MKRAIFHAPGKVTVEDAPDLTIEQPDDVLVRVSLSGICGTEVLAYSGRRPREEGWIGHEFTGVVEAVGSDVERVQVGQRVVSPFSVWCGGCFYCKQGLLTACEHRQTYGRNLPGAHAEVVRVPRAEAVLQPLPDAVSDQQAVFLAHGLSGPFGALKLAGLKAGESVAIVGCGPTGLAAQLAARTMGAGRIIVFDHHGDRVKFAIKQGTVPYIDGRGVDLAIEATGTAEALAYAVDLVRPWGTVLSLGVGVEETASFPIGRLAAKHARLVPAGAVPVKNYMLELMHMIERGVIDPSPIATHTLPLADANRGYELMAKRANGALKVLLKP